MTTLAPFLKAKNVCNQCVGVMEGVENDDSRTTLGRPGDDFRTTRGRLSDDFRTTGTLSLFPPALAKTPYDSLYWGCRLAGYGDKRLTE